MELDVNSFLFGAIAGMVFSLIVVLIAFKIKEAEA